MNRLQPVLGVVHGVFLYGHIPDLGHRHILSIAGSESQVAGGSSDQTIYFLYANSLLGVFLRSGYAPILECNRLLRGTNLGTIPPSRLV